MIPGGLGPWAAGQLIGHLQAACPLMQRTGAARWGELGLGGEDQRRRPEGVSKNSCSSATARDTANEAFLNHDLGLGGRVRLSDILRMCNGAAVMPPEPIGPSLLHCGAG